MYIGKIYNFSYMYFRFTHTYIFVIYNDIDYMCNYFYFIYSVKPAVFDLFLTIGIILYLGILYMVVHNFPHAYALATRLSAKSKTT